MLPEEDSALSPKCHKRRRTEFTLGRAAAHIALARAGCNERGPIYIGAHRQPLWPAGYSGSITHAGEYAMAAAASSDTAAYIGVDLEKMRAECSRLTEYVCDEEEQEWVGGDCWRFLAVFSAKECVYKALFPAVQQFFGFKDAHVGPPNDARAGFGPPASGQWAGTLTARIKRPLGAAVRPGFEMSIGVQIKDQYVFTYTWGRPENRPI